MAYYGVYPSCSQWNMSTTPIGRVRCDYSAPRTGALAQVVEHTEKLAEAMVPLLDEYFAGQQAGGT